MIKTLKGAQRFFEKNRGDLFIDRATLYHSQPSDFSGMVDEFNMHKITSILLINGQGFRQIACMVSTYNEGSRENTAYSPSRAVFEYFKEHAQERPAKASSNPSS